MHRFRNTLFYLLTMAGFGALMYLIVKQGETAQPNMVVPTGKGAEGWQLPGMLASNIGHPLAILLLQIVTIIITARVFGFLCNKIGQPAVIGEILAGIVLGPSVVGSLLPAFSQFLFPASSLSNLQFFSQIGLILFMFIVGMELDLKTLQKKAHDAVVISHASIILPFALGMGLALYLYRSFAPPQVNFLSFSLFIGISVSITAFPVLARIVQERQLSRTRLGAIVITCAAADDITAWCILAAVIAIVKAGSLMSALYVIALAVLYLLLMLKAVKPFLHRLGDIYSSHDTLSKPVVAVFLVTLVVSAWLTEIIGIHALFGAFMAGVIMPQSMHFRTLFIEKVEDVSLVLLLPLFFVFTGLRTQIGLLADAGLWGTCLLIIVVAIAGKFVGSAVAARIVGQSWKNSLSIGALMNTRGLMELIVLNIGYDLGILNSSMFAMLVIMALTTTFMTGPALDLINYIWRDRKDPVHDAVQNADIRYRILFAFGNPDHARGMLRLVRALSGNPSQTDVTALHMEQSSELHPHNIREVERDRFKPVKREALKQNVNMQTIFKPTVDLEKEIVSITNAGNYDLLVIGMGRSIYEGSALGSMLNFTTRVINPEKVYRSLIGKENLIRGNGFDGRTNTILHNVKTSVGIFADKGLKQANDLAVLLNGEPDAHLLQYAQHWLKTPSARVSMIDLRKKIMTSVTLREELRLLEQAVPGRIAHYSGAEGEKIIQESDVVLLSLDTWQEIIAAPPQWLESSPSLLILKK